MQIGQIFPPVRIAQFAVGLQLQDDICGRPTLPAHHQDCGYHGWKPQILHKYEVDCLTNLQMIIWYLHLLSIQYKRRRHGLRGKETIAKSGEKSGEETKQIVAETCAQCHIGAVDSLGIG